MSQVGGKFMFEEKIEELNQMLESEQGAFDKEPIRLMKFSTF